LGDPGALIWAVKPGWRASRHPCLSCWPFAWPGAPAGMLGRRLPPPGRPTAADLGTQRLPRCNEPKKRWCGRGVALALELGYQRTLCNAAQSNAPPAAVQMPPSASHPRCKTANIDAQRARFAAR
jgi:hypothetical protein